MNDANRVIDHLVATYGARPTGHGAQFSLSIQDGAGGSRLITWTPRKAHISSLFRALARDAREALGRGGTRGGGDLALVLLDEELETFDAYRGELLVGPRAITVLAFPDRQGGKIEP